MQYSTYIRACQTSKVTYSGWMVGWMDGWKLTIEYNKKDPRSPSILARSPTIQYNSEEL